MAARLIDAFWPEALCLVLPKKPTIPDRFTGGLATIAVMTAANPVISGVVSGVDAPLFGTTVNYSGEPSIRFAADAAEFFDRVDVTIGDDSIPVYHKSSTMVDCTVDPPAVGPSPEDQVMQKQDAAAVQTIHGRFDDDEEAQLVLLGWQDDLGGAALRDATGLGQGQLDYAIRRIRTRMRKAYPRGWMI